jgi:hypothetical protein
MDSKKKKEYDDKEFAPCDLKVIILGDSAVGKSKFEFLFIVDWSKDSC